MLEEDKGSPDTLINKILQPLNTDLNIHVKPIQQLDLHLW